MRAAVLLIGSLWLVACLPARPRTADSGAPGWRQAPGISPRMGHASSLAGMMQQFSLALGVAIGGYALVAAGALAGVGQTHALAFGGAFAIVALLSAPSLVFFGKLRPDAGAQVSGKAEPRHEVVEPKAEQRPAT